MGIFLRCLKKLRLNAWLNDISHTQNAPKTSREVCQIKCWRKEEMKFIISFFKAKIAKLENVSFFQLHYTGIVIFTKTGTLLTDFRCCKCVFTLFNIWSGSVAVFPVPLNTFLSFYSCFASIFDIGLWQYPSIAIDQNYTNEISSNSPRTSIVSIIRLGFKRQLKLSFLLALLRSTCLFWQYHVFMGKHILVYNICLISINVSVSDQGKIYQFEYWKNMARIPFATNLSHLLNTLSVICFRKLKSLHERMCVLISAFATQKSCSFES